MSVVLWRFHMGNGPIFVPPPPPRIEIGGGLRRKRRKTHEEYLREAAAVFAAIEAGTYTALADRLKAAKKAQRLAKLASLVKTKQAAKTKLAQTDDDEAILMLLMLDLL